MDKQLRFFLAAIALITGAYFLYDFISAYWFSDASGTNLVVLKDQAKRSALMGMLLMLTGAFFVYIGLNTRQEAPGPAAEES